MEAGSVPTEEEIARLARKLIAAYGWRAVDDRLIAGRVKELIAAGAAHDGPYGLERLCERAAAEQLYAASMRVAPATHGVNGEQRWNQAYQDLHSYLLAAGQRMRHTPPPGVQWEDVVQDTLIEVYAKIANCREPQAFLAFAVIILNRKRIARWRERQVKASHEQSLDEAEDNDGGLTPGRAIAGLHGNLAAPAERADAASETEIFMIIGNCLLDDDQRKIALGLIFGLKRREVLLMFQNLKDKFDNKRQALLKRLHECSRFQALFDPTPRPEPFYCPAYRCPFMSPSYRSS